MCCIAKSAPRRVPGRRRASAPADAELHVLENGQRKPLQRDALRRLVVAACEGLADALPEPILEATLRDLYDGVPMDEVRKSAVLAARALIEKDPAYSYVTARLLLNIIRLEVLGEEASQGRWRRATPPTSRNAWRAASPPSCWIPT